MQWLCIIRPYRPNFVATATEEERAVVGRHFEHLVKLHGEGKLLLAGRTQVEEPIGLKILYADSEAEAWDLVNADPAVQEGVFIPELYPYAVAVGAGAEG